MEMPRLAKTVESRPLLTGTLLVLYLVSLAALLTPVPAVVGSVSMGLLFGLVISRLYIHEPMQDSAPTLNDVTTSNNEPTVETEIIPYNQWPDECYTCKTEIESDMDVRGQFVVHKGNSTTKTKAVPLCEECTWTHSTLVDNHDTIVELYDHRENPVEL